MIGKLAPALNLSYLTYAEVAGSIMKYSIEEQSIEELEHEIWQDSSPDVSSLTKICARLRKKKINTFTIEDFRILISQNIGLKFLIPFILDLLRRNPFAGGDYSEGDVLKSVLSSNPAFWKQQPHLKKELIVIASAAIKDSDPLNISRDVKDELKKRLDQFKEL